MTGFSNRYIAIFMVLSLIAVPLILLTTPDSNSHHLEYENIDYASKNTGSKTTSSGYPTADSANITVISDFEMSPWIPDLDSNSTFSNWSNSAQLPQGISYHKHQHHPRDRISTGYLRSCIIPNDGSVYCWGYNGNQGLGNGTSYSSIPIQTNFSVNRNHDFIIVKSAEEHSCALAENNSIVCWGHMFGIENWVSFPAGSTIQDFDISTNVENTGAPGATGPQGCALLQNRSVYCWSASEMESSLLELPQSTVVKKISLGQVFGDTQDMCLLSVNGIIYCSGRNDDGQLGLGHQWETSGWNQPSFPSGMSALDIESGKKRNCAVLSGPNDNSIYCWGHNWNGELGTGPINGCQSCVHPTPDIISGPTNSSDIPEIYMGREHTCILYPSSGGHWCTGLDYYPVSGNGGGRTFQQLTGSNSIGQIALSIGTLNQCIVKSSGDVYCLGGTAQGATGNGNPGCGSGVSCSYHYFQQVSGGHSVDSNNILPGTIFGSPSSLGVEIIELQGEINGTTVALFVNMSVSEFGEYSGVSHLVVNETISPINLTLTFPDLLNDYSFSVSPALPTGLVLSATNGSISGTPQYTLSMASYSVVATSDNGSGNIEKILVIQTQCQPGNYSSGYNQSTTQSCIQADPGNYVSGSGAYSQTPCPPGTYQPNYGQSSCIDATPGYYAAPSQNLTDLSLAYSTSFENLYNGPMVKYFDTGNYSLDHFLWNNPNEPIVSHNSTNTSELGFRAYYKSNGGVGLTDGDYVGLNGYNGTVGSFSDGTMGYQMSDTDGIMQLIFDNRSNISYVQLDLFVQGGASNSYEQTDHLIIKFLGSNSTLELLNITGGMGASNNGGFTNYMGIWTTLNFSVQGSGNLVVEVSTNSGSESIWIDNVRFYISTGAISQNPCSPGTYQSNSGQISCLDASPGNYVSTSGAATQTPCSAGTYQPNYGMTYCLQSSPGYYVGSTGSSNQTACSIGMYQPNSGQLNCINASAGYFVNNSGSSVQYPCNNGSYQPNMGQSSCLDASPGNYVSTSGAATQTPCSAGTYQPNYGMAYCLQSSPGYYVGSTGSSNQTACSSGMYQPYSGQTSCINASAGYYVSHSGSSVQYPCTNGTYQPNVGQFSCIEASPGHYVDSSAATEQSECQIGTYQPYYGTTYCYQASPGHYVDSTGSSNQTPCNAGLYNPNSGSISSTECIMASPGHFVSHYGASNQTTCYPGTYQPSPGAYVCIEASQGHYVPHNGSVVQYGCWIGTFQPNYGMTYCYDADPGHYVDQPNSANQTLCSLGTYNPLNGSDNAEDCMDADPGHYVDQLGMWYQNQCYNGTYQPGYAQNSCLEADPGHFVNDIASLVQTPCSPGTFQPNSSSSYCFSADLGHYVDIFGATNQTACQPGTYNPINNSNNSDSCIDTDPGNFSNSPAMYFQIQCQPGSFQPMRGQTVCIEAEPGHYVPEFGLHLQIPCNPGTYNPISGSINASSCIESTPGYYVSESGQPNPSFCEAGTYQPDFGQTGCLQASPGYYVHSNASDNQLIVDLDFYTDEFGSTTPLGCPRNYITLSLGSVSSADCLLDTDGDRNPDSIDNDDDNDGVLDQNDFCNPGEMGWISGLVEDNDGDGCWDSNEDIDDDNDNYPDSVDAFPFDRNEWEDTDSDGQGNNADSDDDNDGLTDIYELSILTNPLSPDTDGDGYSDYVDEFPLDQGEWVDSDGDGVGDNSDFMVDYARYQTMLDLILDLTMVLILSVGLSLLYRNITFNNRNRLNAQEETRLSQDTPGLTEISDEE